MKYHEFTIYIGYRVSIDDQPYWTQMAQVSIYGVLAHLFSRVGQIIWPTLLDSDGPKLKRGLWPIWFSIHYYPYWIEMDQSLKKDFGPFESSWFSIHH